MRIAGLAMIVVLFLAVFFGPWIDRADNWKDAAIRCAAVLLLTAYVAFAVYLVFAP
jgi:formate hydrogenlyase subunit 4